MLQSRTPVEIGPHIRRLLSRLPNAESPMYIDVSAQPHSLPRECFPNVEKHVECHGGCLVCGWDISEWPHVMVEAQFHGVWKSPDGAYLDITPNELGERRILFSSDCSMKYEGRIVNSVREPLAKSSKTLEFIEICDQIFEIQKRNEPLGGGVFQLMGADAGAYRDLQSRHALLVTELQTWATHLQSSSRPGRNAPCPCGSGRKFKKCCGRP